MNSFSQPTNSAFERAAQPATQSAAQSVAQQSPIASRQQLEQLWQASPSRRPQSKSADPWYKQLGRFLIQSLTDSDQVRIWTKITPNGTQWNAYDPKLQRRFSAYSESEMRTWLEQRYHS